MDELQKQVSKTVNELIAALMDKIKEAKQKQDIDLTDFVKELAATNDKININFLEAKLRNRKAGGKKLWG